MALLRTFAFLAVSLFVLASCDSGTTNPSDADVAEIIVLPASFTFEGLGQTVQFLARAVDEDGDSIPGVLLTWSSLDESVVTVTEDGIAEAVGDGSSPIFVEGGGVSGSAQVTVEIAGLQVSTSSLANGRLTIPYEGMILAKGGAGEEYSFELTNGALPSGLELQPDGRILGTPTQIETATFTVRVTDTNSEQASRQLALRVCAPPESFAVGEVRRLAPPPLGECGVFLPSGAGHRYRVAVIRTNTDEDEEDVVNVALSITASGEVGGGVTPAEPGIGLQGGAALPTEAWNRRTEMARATHALHMSVREDEQELFRRIGTSALLPDLRGTGPSRAAAQGPLPNKLRIDPTASTTTCTAGTKVTAIKLAENDWMGIYQDSTQNATPQTRVNAAEARALLDFYRDHGREVIEQYFGGVSDVNGDGKIVVFVASSLTGTEAGLVWSGNFLSSDECPASNHMEIIFLNRSVVTDLDNPNSASQGLETLVHEVKHLSSLYQRLQRSRDEGTGQFHPSWWEEGVAELAGGVASRLAWSRNGGPAVNGMLDAQDWVDALGGSQQLTDNAQWGVLLRLRRTQEYLASQPNGLVVKPVGSRPQHSVYGSGWVFAMWLGDGFGGAGTAALADAPFWAEINDREWPSGIAGIEQATGLSWDELLEEYTLALMLNGTSAQPPAHPITTVDFPSAIEVWCFAADNPSCLGQPDGPTGAFPWPVTARASGPARSFATAVYRGDSGSGGVRIHDFVSDGSGAGSELHAVAPARSRMVVVRMN